MDVSPQQFGEMVANVRNLQDSHTVLNSKIDALGDKFDRLKEAIDTKTGEERASRRFQKLIVVFGSAAVSGCVTWLIDFTRHM
jgi:uncharacterized protein YlxW (UPF0749 family)